MSRVNGAAMVAFGLAFVVGVVRRPPLFGPAQDTKFAGAFSKYCGGRGAIITFTS